METISLQKAVFMIEYWNYPWIENIDLISGYILFSNGEAKAISELVKEYDELFYRKIEY